MKYLILTLIFFSFNCAVAQSAAKLKAIDFRYILKDQSGNFIDAYEWAETNLLITLDVANEKIRVYSKEFQEFDIVDTQPMEKDQYGYSWLQYTCVDKAALRCTIRMVSYGKTFKDQFGKTYAACLYVEYKDEISQYHLTIDNP